MRRGYLSGKTRFSSLSDSRESFFSMNREKATQIMLVVHSEGSAVVGIFPRDIAETKSEQVNNYAQENNHPLMSTVEMTD